MRLAKTGEKGSEKITQSRTVSCCTAGCFQKTGKNKKACVVLQDYRDCNLTELLHYRAERVQVKTFSIKFPTTLCFKE
jgi:hypothetical protein